MITLRIVLALCIACSAPPPPAPPPVAASASTGAVARELGPSIYELELALRDARGTRTGLDVQRGHPTLISMFYGSCASACPALIGAIQRVVDELPANRRDQLRVVLVSFDAERDTPARLRELIATHRLNGRWTLAAAEEPDARALAAVLGVKYRAVEGGEYFHNAVVVALDRDGRPVARMEGFGDHAALIAGLAEQSR
jgi:protein SCO1